MERALIVSCTKKSVTFFSEILNAASINQIVVLSTAGEARRLLLEQDFDLVIVDSPLQDESGENLSRYISYKDLSQVILAVKSEHFNAISAVCESDGVLAVSKPVNIDIFWHALSLAKSAGSRIKRFRDENERLKQKIEDIKIVDRAKLILISCMNMNEKDAHKYIEKQAMDKRSSKRAISEEILKTYEN